MIWITLLAFLKSLWDRFAFYISMAAAAVIALLIAFGKGRSAGKRVYREKHEKAERKAAERAMRIKDNVRQASDKEVSRRLDRWYRD